MAGSYLAQRAVGTIAKGLQKLDEEKLDKLERIVVRSAAALGAVLHPLGAVIEHINKHVSDGHSFLDSDSDQEDVEVEGKDSEGHHKELADIQPFVNMAVAAYEDKDMADQFSFVKRSRLIKDVKRPCVEIVTSKTKKSMLITTDTEVHVCLLEDGSIAFAFRGTEIADWKDLKSMLGDVMTDMMKDLVPVELYDASDRTAYQSVGAIGAHEGFQLAFRDVTKTSSCNENIRLVAEGLGARTTEVKRVICIGHSLGGALATLCAQWCRYVGYPTAEVWCVTIGSPRVGNRAFADDFNKNVVTKGRSYRLVNKGDLIPNIPLFDGVLNIFRRYKHVRGFIFLKEDPTEKDTITLKRGGRRPSSHARNLKDHCCNSYKESVRLALVVFSHRS